MLLSGDLPDWNSCMAAKTSFGIKSGTLDLIDPFVQSHTPKEFADICASHSHGQSPIWLKRLIPVLMSQREEARNLAAFHFCMEAEMIRFKCLLKK